MLPLAVAMMERGHEVVWATAADACPRIEALGIRARPVGKLQAERQAEYRRRWPEGAQLRGEARADHMFCHLLGEIAAHAAEADLLQLASEWQPDLVVNEASEFAAPAIAAALGVPHVTHSFGLAVPAARVGAAGEIVADIWHRLGVEPRPYGGCHDHLYIDIYPPSMQPDELPHIGRITRVRPTSLDAIPGERLPDSVDRQVTSGGSRPVVYLTFGTVFNANATFAAAVHALGGLDATIVVTVGPGAPVDQFGPLPDNVHVAQYIPQSVLLPHCTAVASHAGSGTLLATLARGLPQLCLPQAADQFRNAGACVAAGAGVALRGDEASAGAINASGRRLLDDHALRRGAERMRDEIASMPTPDDVAAELEQLV